MAIKFTSLYWKNVNHDLLKAQKDIFKFFGIDIDQQLHDQLDHGLWMNDQLRNLDDQDILVIVDIDCIPLNHDILKRAVAIAEEGGILGCAQVANHLETKDFIYAAPCFLAIKGRTYRELDSPNMCPTNSYDAGGYLTFIAQKKKVPVHLVYPTSTAVPKWVLSNNCVYGLFTIYEDSILHLFESRLLVLINTFLELKDNIIGNYNQFNHNEYIIKAFNEYLRINCLRAEKNAIKDYKKTTILGKWKSLLKRLRSR